MKVDRYFVSGIERNPVRAEILRSPVDIGRVTGCRIVAEGVENAEREPAPDEESGEIAGRIELRARELRPRGGSHRPE